MPHSWYQCFGCLWYLSLFDSFLMLETMRIMAFDAHIERAITAKNA